mmetsp:Transcript_17110/g.24879  ORF Transcript_17110/g.24879 Transcript_17110/m.24879 type:complete len:255 (-) Transcript_17110:201-965(-)
MTGGTLLGGDDDDDDDDQDHHHDGESHPRRNTQGKRSHRQQQQQQQHGNDDVKQEQEQLKRTCTEMDDPKEQITPLHGFGMGRTSAITLGAPPSISANIKAAFITSVIHGDDIICRASQSALDRLRQRTKKRLDGGMLTKQVGWMTDTLSLTMSSIQSHAHGSEGEEARLSIPGKVYLVRPRSRGGGVSSMHEIGRGRDALRAAILWQLNDVLLSRSLWKHHSLEAYIHSLDKVQLRQIDIDGSEGEGEDEFFI